MTVFTVSLIVVIFYAEMLELSRVTSEGENSNIQRIDFYFVIYISPFLKLR